MSKSACSSKAQFAISKTDPRCDAIIDQLLGFANRKIADRQKYLDLIVEINNAEEEALKEYAAFGCWKKLICAQRDHALSAIETVLHKHGFNIVFYGRSVFKDRVDALSREIEEAQTLAKMLSYGRTVTFGVEYYIYIQQKGASND